MSSAAAVCNEAVPPERAEPWVVDSDYLFETLVCDVHSCAMQIGVIATMLNASQKPDLIGGLRSCRHMLHDDSKIMTLALRYGSEAGLSPGLAAKLDRLYTGVGGAKRRIAPLLAAKDAALAGDSLFLGMVRDVIQRYAAKVAIVSAASGQYVGTMQAGPEVGGLGGWQDMAGSVQATRCANGEYLILVEDDFRAKNLLFRWKP